MAWEGVGTRSVQGLPPSNLYKTRLVSGGNDGLPPRRAQCMYSVLTCCCAKHGGAAAAYAMMPFQVWSLCTGRVKTRLTHSLLVVLSLPGRLLLAILIVVAVGRCTV